MLQQLFKREKKDKLMAKRSESGIGLNLNYIIVSIVVFVILTVLVLYMPGLTAFDGKILHSIRLALSPYPIWFAQFVTEFGRSYQMVWPQIAAGSVLISHKKYVKAFLLIFFTQATYALTIFIKNFVCRERPCVYPEFSFPSGHSSTTMCFYGILIYLVLHYAKSDFWRYFLVTLFSLWILLVGISRLWLGVHYPVDVIAGMFLGFIMVNLYIITAKTLSK